jgi:hypothetical protein
MTVALALIFCALLSLGVLFLAARGRFLRRNELTDIREQIRSVDLEAFRNLMSPDDEEFLRTNLPPRQFRSVQRARFLAAAQYVNCVAGNAAVLLRLGESARSSSDAAVAAAGQELVDAALRLRLYSLMVVIKLYAGAVMPGVKLSPAAIADRYQHMSGLVGRLSRMHYPSRTARIPAAL